jgi:tripartite-type tricarboxylate transporter receptor subunit TctC
MSTRLIALIGCLLFPLSLSAQVYPEKTISLVVPFAPGTSADIFARVVSQAMQDQLGQTVLVENKPGGNAAIGAEYVARSKPDGYTLILSTASAHASNVHLFKNLRYDPIKDFEPVSWIGTVNFFAAVSSESPYKTFHDLVDYARKNPGKVTIGSSNASAIVASRAIAKLNNIDLLQVAYKNTPQVTTDVIGGRLDVMIHDFPAAAGHLQAGRIRPLGLTGAKRSTLYPEIPALAELGMTGFDMIGWFAIYAPVGTPSNIVSKLNAGLKEIMSKPDIVKRLNEMGYEALSTSPEELRTHTQNQIDIWKRYVADYDIKVE